MAIHMHSMVNHTHAFGQCTCSISAHISNINLKGSDESVALFIGDIHSKARKLDGYDHGFDACSASLIVHEVHTSFDAKVDQKIQTQPTLGPTSVQVNHSHK